MHKIDVLRLRILSGEIRPDVAGSASSDRFGCTAWPSTVVAQLSKPIPVKIFSGGCRGRPSLYWRAVEGSHILGTEAGPTASSIQKPIERCQVTALDRRGDRNGDRVLDHDAHHGAPNSAAVDASSNCHRTTAANDVTTYKRVTQ